MTLADKMDNEPVYKTLFGMPEGQDARVLAEKSRALTRENKLLVHVALDDRRLSVLSELLDFFAPDVECLCFPAWDCLPYDRVSPHQDIVAKRVSILFKLMAWQDTKERRPRIVLTSVNAMTQRVTPRTVLEHSGFCAQKGCEMDMAQLLCFLQKNGYVRTETVREPREYAIRGGIIDLFSPSHQDPVRLDLFGSEIESIRVFDASSQLTKKTISEFNLLPATEFFLDDHSIALFRSHYRDLFGVVRGDDPLYEAVSSGRRYNGMDHWLPLFFEQEMLTLFDYVPNAAITMDHHSEQSRSERFSQINDFYASRKTMEAQAERHKKTDMAGTVYHPVPVKRLFIDGGEWSDLLHGMEGEILSPFAAPEENEALTARKGRDFADIRALPDGDVFKALSDYIDLQRKNKRKIMIVAYSKGSSERLSGLMQNAGFTNFKDIKTPDDIKKLGAYDIGLALLSLEHGFIAPDLTVITEQDILGDRLARKSKKRKRADNFLTEISSLSPGELVVHVDHGIGRFESLETLKADKKLHDCLKIIYAGDDRLFVPVENIEVLTRFGGDGETIKLDKLGGAGWQARKARAKKDLMAMADELLKIAAARKLKKAETYTVDKEHYEQFISGFPYQETEDQQRSIEAVLADLDCDHPMDRLICGDVGFGKTEVALRAAYVTAMNGAQVALIVPTTLLARQHYQNFMQRFKGAGLRVEQLSRLVSAKDAERTRRRLADGTVNIVIGTHALFASSIKFAHLGLVIVDEEQRFGVKQKEKLKALKNNVHVLTLTATPIPRTLQMSLTGVKEMSLIATPPVDRLAIRSFVLPYDPLVIREALLREHYRGGQSFYVCPRIKDMKALEEQLTALVPEVKLVTAHGQMSATDLEDRMTAFYDGQYDVLLATNIIESGIDIPTANTMVIHRADMFGLAQLYQIRGRIGRSKIRAYAYLTYDPAKKLTNQGQKRLEVIETLDTLGGGFKLASHDMDIRGAGNLLGDSQSGHVKEIGVELYQQMLEEAVAAAREGLDFTGEEELPDRWSPQINIGTSVLIPEYYVADLNVRMSLYRRLSELEDKDEIESFAAELIDRFGAIPEEVENLFHIMTIKQLCRAAGVDRVDAGPKGVVFGFHNDVPPDIEGLMRWMQKQGGASIKMRHDQKLVATRQWGSAAERVTCVQSLMKELAAL